MDKTDLTGKEFGLLRVIEPADVIIRSRNAFWKCECTCGEIAYVSYTGLVTGAYTNCGCEPKEETQ